MTARPRTRKPRASKKPASKPEPTEAAPEPAAPSPVVEPAEVEDSRPERRFAANAPAPEPERPRPSRKRAVFIDVENTSRSSRVTEALTDLAIDKINTQTELIASGNWRVIGNETARLLAKEGAQLMHSAPATGVRDWSDLRIAVSAGVWLATARPGDRLDIVSDDRAFDAVGDVAASLGVTFHRHSYRNRGGRAAATATATATAEPVARERGGRGRRRGGRRGSRVEEPVVAAAEPLAPPPAEPTLAEAVEAAEVRAHDAAPHAAPKEDLLVVVRDLITQNPTGVWLDAIANQLKKLGYQRPPNSPRLVTRVRALPELDVSPRGFVTLKGAAPVGEPGEPPAAPAEGAPVGAPAKRRRRRGGRGRAKVPPPV